MNNIDSSAVVPARSVGAFGQSSYLPDKAFQYGPTRQVFEFWWGVVERRFRDRGARVMVRMNQIEGKD